MNILKRIDPMYLVMGAGILVSIIGIFAIHVVDPTHGTYGSISAQYFSNTEHREEYERLLSSSEEITNNEIQTVVSRRYTDEQYVENDTTLFLEKYAVAELGRHKYYGILKPMLLDREKQSGENAHYYMAMMYLESRFKTTATNYQGSGSSRHIVAGGINQMTAIALKDARLRGSKSLPQINTVSEYIKLDLETQLKFLFQYYDIFHNAYPDVKLDSPDKHYLVTFFPKALVSKSYIIAKAGTKVAKQNPSYTLKSGDHKGYITKWSIKRKTLDILLQLPAYHSEVQGAIKV